MKEQPNQTEKTDSERRRLQQEAEDRAEAEATATVGRKDKAAQARKARKAPPGAWRNSDGQWVRRPGSRGPLPLDVVSRHLMAMRVRARIAQGGTFRAMGMGRGGKERPLSEWNLDPRDAVAEAVGATPGSDRGSKARLYGQQGEFLGWWTAWELRDLAAAVRGIEEKGEKG